MPASKAARSAFGEALMARAADFEANAEGVSTVKGKGRSNKGEGKGKGKGKEITAEEKEKKEFNKDLAAQLACIT